MRHPCEARAEWSAPPVSASWASVRPPTASRLVPVRPCGRRLGQAAPGWRGCRARAAVGRHVARPGDPLVAPVGVVPRPLMTAAAESIRLHFAAHRLARLPWPPYCNCRNQANRVPSGRVSPSRRRGRR
jgi:hypothetical protein